MCPELLIADMEDAARGLISCYNRLWETERWPKVWKNFTFVVKVFKKSNLGGCNNWR